MYEKWKFRELGTDGARVSSRGWCVREYAGGREGCHRTTGGCEECRRVRTIVVLAAALAIVFAIVLTVVLAIVVAVAVAIVLAVVLAHRAGRRARRHAVIFLVTECWAFVSCS